MDPGDNLLAPVRELIDAAARSFGESGVWFALVEDLLLFCCDHRQVFSDTRARGTAEFDLGLLQAAGEVEGLLRRHGGGVPLRVGPLRNVLVDWLHERALIGVPDEAAAVVAARALALGIDAAAYETYVKWLRDREWNPLEVGRMHPVHRYDPRHHGVADPTSNPISAPTLDLGVLPHARLGSSLLDRVRVEIDFDSHDRLSALSIPKPLHLVASQPNLSLFEFDVEYTPGTFNNRGVHDLDAQIAALQAHLRAASEAEASIVVVPEYCLPEAGRDAVQAVLDELRRDGRHLPAIVVGGTSEVHGDGRVTNQACIWQPGGGDTRVISLDKIHPALIDGRLEGVDTADPPKLKIFWSGHWAAAVLICRDAMADDLVELLSQIGVNLLMVPSMTDHRDASLVGSAERLRVTTQAFVIVAIAPAKWTDEELHTVSRSSDRTEAAFIGPYQQDPASTRVPRDVQGPVGDGRGTWHFDGETRVATWRASQ